jgi:hypothetical protein
MHHYGKSIKEKPFFLFTHYLCILQLKGCLVPLLAGLKKRLRLYPLKAAYRKCFFHTPDPGNTGVGKRNNTYHAQDACTTLWVRTIID